MTTKKTKKSILPETERLQILQKKTIREIFINMGFQSIGSENIDFVYKYRPSEIDDMFIFENLIVICEYTVSKKPGDHLKEKKIIYDLINQDHLDFLSDLVEKNVFSRLSVEVNTGKYQRSQYVIVILYCSYFPIEKEHKCLVSGVHFFDRHIVEYFKMISKAINKSSIYEFCQYIGVSSEQIGNNVLSASTEQLDKFHTSILPVEHNSTNIQSGFNIISFYIDAQALLKRIYVLRKECWRADDGGYCYQRMIDAKKIRQMRKYLVERKRVFVNNIIATIAFEDIVLRDNDNNRISINKEGSFYLQKSDNQAKTITNIMPAKVEIKNAFNLMGIIDGQHRIYAYHEGVDELESEIAKMRVAQDLLITAIVYPPSFSQQDRLKFEARLFLDINRTPTKVKENLHQEIEHILEPFSSTSISKDVIAKLNSNGPLENLFVRYSYDKDKIPTSSIVSYGLKSLIQCDDSAFGLFHIWDHKDKNQLTQKQCDNYALKAEYVQFCALKIIDLFVCMKKHYIGDWHVYDGKTKTGRLTIGFINGMLSLLKNIIVNEHQLYSQQEYEEKFADIEKFPFKEYGGSRYARMGKDLYEKYFMDEKDHE